MPRKIDFESLTKIDPELLLFAACERAGTEIRQNALDAIHYLCRYIYECDETEKDVTETYNRIFGVITRAYSEAATPLITASLDDA